MSVDRCVPRNSCLGLARHILSNVEATGGPGLSEETLTAMLLRFYDDAYKAGFQDGAQK